MHNIFILLFIFSNIFNVGALDPSKQPPSTIDHSYNVNQDNGITGRNGGRGIILTLMVIGYGTYKGIRYYSYNKKKE